MQNLFKTINTLAPIVNIHYAISASLNITSQLGVEVIYVGRADSWRKGRSQEARRASS